MIKIAPGSWPFIPLLLKYYLSAIALWLLSTFMTSRCNENPWQNRVCAEAWAAKQACSPYDIGPTLSEKALESWCYFIWRIFDPIVLGLFALAGIALIVIGLRFHKNLPLYVRLSTFYSGIIPLLMGEALYAAFMGHSALGFNVPYIHVYHGILAVLGLICFIQTLRSFGYIMSHTYNRYRKNG